MLRLFVRETYISSFPLFGKMDLALHQSLGACSLHVVPKTTACFSFSVGRSDSICYYAFCCVQKASVCLICNGCQGLGEMCFQLPLGRMTDGKTIKHTTAAQCVCVLVCMRGHVHPCTAMYVRYACMHSFVRVCVDMQASVFVFDFSRILLSFRTVGSARKVSSQLHKYLNVETKLKNLF